MHFRSQVLKHAGIVHERAFGARTIKYAKMNVKNPSKRGKQAKFKARFAISRGLKPAFAILLFDLLQ